MHWLDERLSDEGQKICFMAEYFLPDVEKLHALSCGYELKILQQPDFAELYRPEWSNALCEDRKELDVLGVGAYDCGRLVGLAVSRTACQTDKSAAIICSNAQYIQFFSILTQGITPLRPVQFRKIGLLQ